MPQIFDGKTDLTMTLDGDLSLGSNGELLHTSGFDWLAREINKIVRTVNPEWRDYPYIGANVEEFGGQENSREIGLQMQRQIKAAIDRATILDYGQSVNVRVVPVDLSSVAVIISVDVGETRTTLSKLIFEFTNGTIREVSDISATTKESKIDEIHRIPPVNTIRDRIRKR